MVEIFAKRLQTQETMTAQIADAIEAALRPRGVAVLIEAEHQCMSMRGVRQPGVKTITTRFTGALESGGELSRPLPADGARPAPDEAAGLLIRETVHGCRPTALFAARGTAAEIESGLAFQPKFDADGLIPAIVTDAASGEVLMFAWMNAEALAATLETRIGHFWSRSRAKLWKKGEESGNVLRSASMRTDCDQDAVVAARSTWSGDGVACHTGRALLLLPLACRWARGPRPTSRMRALNPFLSSVLSARGRRRRNTGAAGTAWHAPKPALNPSVGLV